MMRQGFACAAVALAALPALAAPQPVEAPYAVIDWPNKLNPDVVTLGHDDFLLLTDRAFVVWNALSRQTASARGWPRRTAIAGQWSRLAGGTLVAGRSHTDDTDLPFASLVWWNPATRSFAPPLVLPPGSEVQQLVALDAQLSMACLGGGQTAANRAILLRVKDGALRQEPLSPAARSAALQAGIRGKIDDVELGAPPARPLSFDTATCKWTISAPPKEYAKDAARGFQPYYLADGTLAVVPQQSEWPLRWDAGKAAWVVIAEPGARMGIAGNYGNFDRQDPLVFANGSAVSWFDPVTRRVLPLKRLPDTYIPILAPLSDGGIVVFLRERGAVLRLPPFKSSP